MVRGIFILLTFTLCACDDTRVYFTPSPDCENNIIAEINQADKIDIAVYSITNKNIVNAILDAENRGAEIRVITDRVQASGKHSLAGKIKDAGISVLTNARHKIEHNKFAVFDNNLVVTGSYNWTMNATEHNSENCVFLHGVADKYSARFEYLWGMYSDR